MHIFRGIRMMMVRLITRATRHHELRATCFPRGGVPTELARQESLYHMQISDQEGYFSEMADADYQASSVESSSTENSHGVIILETYF